MASTTDYKPPLSRSPPPQLTHTKLQRARTSSDDLHLPSSATASTSSAIVSSRSQIRGDRPPPAKRARKAINCEPCRNSKLKCDRNRPCSSCTLRGTADQCYQDVHDYEPPTSAPLPSQVRKIRPEKFLMSTDCTPEQSFAIIEHHLNLLRTKGVPAQSSTPLTSSRPIEDIKPKLEPGVEPSSDPPGRLVAPDQGGFYTGATSISAHLVNERNESDEGERPSAEPAPGMLNLETFPASHDYDRDLLKDLPELPVIDQLIAFYFDYCNWNYRHVNDVAFREAWNNYKGGRSPDRITLATVAIIMAVALHFLPENDELLRKLPHSEGGPQEQGEIFHGVMKKALARHMEEGRHYRVELIELQLIRAFYLTLSKTDTEEIWAVRGELISVGVAMGLHRDPGRWRMPLLVQERRRWAWWHIILLERWQAFMFGRPIAISDDHYDTRLPSYCNPALDPTQRLYLPNITLIRLAHTIGSIMDDALSTRGVRYEEVERNDRILQGWLDDLPPELDMDEFRMARALASEGVRQRRLGVQSVILTCAYYHIRFTLHRPYTNASAKSNSRLAPEKIQRSMDTAVNAAGKLINLVAQVQPEFFNNTSLAVPGHMNWLPLHVFSAAMFFSFQLIASPDQLGTGVFRSNIKKAIETLEQSKIKGLPLADKALRLLTALEPLYSSEFLAQPPREREKKKSTVLAEVKRLAFPYHDPLPHGGMHGSPASRPSVNSPQSFSQSPPMNMNMVSAGSLAQATTPTTLTHPQQQQHQPSHHQHQDMSSSSVYNLPPMSSMRTSNNATTNGGSNGSLVGAMQSYASPTSTSNPMVPQAPGQPQTHTPPITNMLTNGTGAGFYSPQQETSTNGYGGMHHSQSMYVDGSGAGGSAGGGASVYRYVHPIDEGGMGFGAAAGIGQTEWAWFTNEYVGNGRRDMGR